MHLRNFCELASFSLDTFQIIVLLATLLAAIRYIDKPRGFKQVAFRQVAAPCIWLIDNLNRKWRWVLWNFQNWMAILARLNLLFISGQNSANLKYSHKYIYVFCEFMNLDESIHSPRQYIGIFLLFEIQLRRCSHFVFVAQNYIRFAIWCRTFCFAFSLSVFCCVFFHGFLHITIIWFGHKCV